MSGVIVEITRKVDVELRECGKCGGFIAMTQRQWQERLGGWG